ncbi:putative autophagy-related protein 11 isoform X2 [Cataglyphis hispanica]|uniref:putative autophagy-related protein 11 isoform X2 n=1 Tax=Cataglyphis hispanica TaxID=1086592 RepID=UPI00217FAD54|nr:putative autophagy-related protein 11 isoform X2 [Cataglyphis hispanica]
MDSMEHKIPKVECQTSIVGNNEPLFKLDEPVTTALNISSTTTNNFNDEDSLSFVVLGKDSIDATQASVLASYVDIQQKSMSIDYTSMILPLSTDEMQKKLTDVLQENVKLKETLKQNTLSMKEQFNTLAMWQEEVMKVHETHKKKFAETRELVTHLKKENAELKTELSQLQHTESIGFETIGTILNDTTDVYSAQTELQQIVPKLKTAISKMDLEECKHYITCIISEKFAEKALQDKLEELKMEKELESAMKSLSYVDSQNSAKIIENQKILEEKNEEIKHLKESIALLEEKLQCALTPIQLPEISKSSTSLSHQKFVQNIKQYNDLLQELTECYVQQIERFATIEKSLKEITDILMILDDDNSKMQFYQYREKLCYCCKQLADEQVKIISDRQTLIKSQKQFQNIFSDYNSILYELEMTIYENAKLNVLKDNSTRENMQKLEELEQIKRDKQLFEEEKRILKQEKDNLEEEKKSLESQKKSLDVERVSLCDEKQLVMQEKISLNEEKMSLDHQSQLYENCEKALQKEKKLLQVYCEELLDKANILEQKAEKKNIEFKEIMEQLAQSMEEINLLRSQLTIYEEDFQCEKRLKESLLEEKSKLEMELQKQAEYNKKLQTSAVQQTTSSNDANGSEYRNGVITACPKCAKPYQGLSALMEHIERCLD